MSLNEEQIKALRKKQAEKARRGKSHEPEKPKPLPQGPRTLVLARTVGSLSAGTRVELCGGFDYVDDRILVRTVARLVIREAHKPEKVDHVVVWVNNDDIVYLRSKTRG